MDWRTFAMFLGALVMSTAAPLENKDLDMTGLGDINNMCEGDEITSKMCYQCKSFDSLIGVTFEACCSDKRTFKFCDACMNDPDSCRKLMREIENANTFSEDYYDAEEDNNHVTDDTYANPDKDLFDMQDVKPDLTVDKRYGRLFVQSPKRFGRVFFGERGAFRQVRPIDKRYGRVFLGSGGYFGKREFDEDSEEDDQDMPIDKRYGRLFATKYFKANSQKNHWFGKRSFAEIPFDESVPEKRYGRIYLGRNKGLFGKRSSFDEETSEEFSSENDDVDLPMEKRFGRLYMNRMNLFRYRPYDKRYGRLFTGPRRQYFG
ncbi:uncharacterized protein LOC127838812 [Dreissena polymorpha]|uniref:Uncharacterized protein n=1 Tax=Dreissena polymorpha TaxID=45954 RepID=A0A9D4FHM2_DREPO|nr:uncharacterized protein LOC127838812 [Dreissena polymorpha]XP_052222771.1 uncharacterized protein LOC127838812 [Dreissena polymorpha]KAH3798462.1 hypothetical protein DPMN_152061 [Dreissena polymorpha]